jgi:hypothetical protein
MNFSIEIPAATAAKLEELRLSPRFRVLERSGEEEVSRPRWPNVESMLSEWLSAQISQFVPPQMGDEEKAIAAEIEAKQRELEARRALNVRVEAQR